MTKDEKHNVLMGQKPENKISLNCRICGGETFSVIDLGHQPFANGLLDGPSEDAKTYPLELYVCKDCSVGQLSYCADAKELYENYLYESPKSDTMDWHFQEIFDFLSQNNYINDASNILEIGSNIGRFLEFLKPHVSSILGIDPAINISKRANEAGIPTVIDFFNASSAEAILKEQGKKDVIIAQHCFAHNEKPQLMLEGVKKLLSADGVFLIENAYFLDTVEHFEVDQIYHEHMYFYNVRSLSTMLEQFGLMLVDVKHSPTHGGSMQYIVQFKSSNHPVHERVREFLEKEKNMHQEDFYHEFVTRIESNKKELCDLLKSLLSEKKTIHVYGASAKSTMLLNYHQVNSDIAPYAVDSTKIKHGKFIPKVNIKVISEEEAVDNPPDYYLLTSWNYKDEIINKVRSAGNSKTKFILPHPQLEVIEG